MQETRALGSLDRGAIFLAIATPTPPMSSSSGSELLSDEEQKDSFEEKSKAPHSSSNDELDDEDRELVEENLRPSKRFRRLIRSKEAEKSVQLEDLFSQSSSEEDLAVEQEEQEIDDFVVYEDDDEEPETKSTRKRSAPTVARKKPASKPAAPQYDVSKFYEAFGDGTDYAYAVEAAATEPSQEPIGLSSTFEPAVLERSHRTPKDDAIRSADWPERFTTRTPHPVTQPSNPLELEKEAVWVAKRLSLPNAAPDTPEATTAFVKAIHSVLEFIRIRGLEVPFIATHRKEICLAGYLQLQDLWAIYDADAEWSAFFSAFSRAESKHSGDLLLLEALNSAATVSDCLLLQQHRQSAASESILSALSSGLSGPIPPLSKELLKDARLVTALKQNCQILLSTAPTESGRREIRHAAHQYFSVKYLKSIPIDQTSAISSELYLLLLAAERAALVTSEWTAALLPEAHCRLQRCGWSDSEISSFVALFKELLIRPIKIARERQAIAAVTASCQAILQQRMLPRAPLIEPEAFVLSAAFCAAPVTGCQAAVLDGNGTLVAQTNFTLIGRDSSLSPDLLSLLDRYKPAVALVSGRNCNQLADLLRAHCQIAFVWDEAVATDVPLVVAIARYHLRPVQSLAQVFIANSEFLLQSAILHPQQHLLSRDQMLATIERALISVVNFVGVTSDQPALLSFVCGLGQRKGAQLAEILPSAGSRQELRSALGPIVWQNSSSFIKFPLDAVDPLDSTRIAPETYAIARKMAANALDLEDATESDSHGTVRNVMRQCERLAELDLPGFASELLQRHGVDRSLTLQHIKDELSAPFSVPFASTLSPEESFSVSVGCLPVAIIGTIIPVTIKKIVPGKGAFCKPSANISCTGYLPPSHLSPTEQEGDIVPAIVVAIEVDRFSVRLESLEAANEGAPPVLSIYWDETRARDDQQALAIAEREEAVSLNHRKITTRHLTSLCSHPQFRRSTASAASKDLDTKGVPGDFLIVPLVRAPGRATSFESDVFRVLICVKITETSNRIVRIEASGSLPIAGDDSLKWTVRNDSFASIAELCDRLVLLLVDFWYEALGHPKFLSSTTDPIAWLKEAKERTPTIIPFCLHLPAASQLTLSWLPGRSTVRSVGISVLPNGFGVSEQLFERLDDLIVTFKRGNLLGTR